MKASYPLTAKYITGKNLTKNTVGRRRMMQKPFSDYLKKKALTV
jgi:hypothetical protein